MELKFFRKRNPFIWIYLNIGTYEGDKRIAFNIWIGFQRTFGFSVEKILREET